MINLDMDKLVEEEDTHSDLMSGDSDECGSDISDEENSKEGDSENEEEAGVSRDSENGEEADISQDSENEEDAGISRDSKIKHNSEWADAMAKILNTHKPKRKKTIVLAKAKKLKPSSLEDDVDDDVKETVPFEVVGEDVETKPKVKSESVESKKLKAAKDLENRIMRKHIVSKGRVKPSVLDKDREKVLQKAATKGVVQLFNAVRQQQKCLETEVKKVGPSNRKQEKVLQSVDKRAFLDVLMGAKSQAVPQVKEETNDWAVLRSDFMMGTKLKDWDKKDDNS